MGAHASKTIPALLGLLVAAGAGVWIQTLQRPPEAVPASAPADAFSAERAMRHVVELGSAPRPLGSAAHADARRYLVDQLEGLGFETEVQEDDHVARRAVDRFFVVRVRNVVARLSGRSSTGALLLAAHYDSRPTTPGAGDALSGTAAILEAVRAAISGPPLDNDLIVLITDSEELGLNGARVFVERHRWAADVRMVVNLEARGNRGPAAMFETRAGNEEVIRALATATPYPYATSMSYEVYRRMPNDTDFSVFRDAGVQGLNVAPTGNLAAYHTRLDSAASLDRGTLQHHGSYALGLIRHFGNSDLAAIPDADGGDAVYFNPYPWKLVVYPAERALHLAGGAALLYLVIVAVGVRRKRLAVGGVLRGLVILLISLAAAGLVGWCFWWLIRNYLPHLLFGPYGRPYDVELLVGSVALLVAATCGALFAWLRESRGGLELWAGGWLGWSLINFALAGFVPGASYLTTWPLVGGVVGLLVLVVLSETRWQPAIMAIATLPTVILWVPTTWAVAEALTLAAAAAIGVACGLVLTTVAPLLGTLHRATGGKTSTILMLTGVGILVWVAARSEPSAATPAVDTLAYAVDTDTGEAWWASFDPAPDAWTSQVLGEVAEQDWAPAAFALPDTQVLVTGADPVELPAPIVRTLSDSRADGRRVEGVVSSTRGAAVLRIRAEASVPLHAVSIEGERFELAGDPEAEGLGLVWITAYGFGSEELRVGFEVADAWPIELGVVDQSWGFDALPSPPSPRPDNLIPSPTWRTDSVYVHRSSLM